MSTVLHASSTQIASGNDSGSVDTLDLSKHVVATRLSKQLIVQLNVTAASGTTPTLDVLVEHSIDKINWYTLGTFAEKVAAGTELLTLANAAKFIRTSWTIGGTDPSFTFQVDFDLQV